MHPLLPNKQHAGFTLIELLIVIVILSSLATIVVPQFSSVGESSKNSSVAANAKIIQSAIDRYNADNGFHPSKAHYGQVCAGIDLSRNASLGKPYSFLLNRLALFGDGSGGICDSRKNNFKLGPYLKSHVPSNPRNGSAAIKILPTAAGQDNSSTDFGWTYDPNTGEFLPFEP